MGPQTFQSLGSLTSNHRMDIPSISMDQVVCKQIMRFMSHVCFEIGRHTEMKSEMQRRVTGIATESLYRRHEVSPEPCLPGKITKHNTHGPMSKLQSNKESQRPLFKPFLSRIPSFCLATSPWIESKSHDMESGINWNKYRTALWRNHFLFHFRSHPRRLSTFRKVWISTGNCL